VSTPSARFVIAFDADTSGISQSKSALDSLQASIEKDTKALSEMQAAMQRLKGTAEVARFEALPRDIAKAESEVTKLEKQMASLKTKLDAAPAGKKDAISAELAKAQGELGKATAKVGGLRKEQAGLAQTSPVKAFNDLKLASEKLKGSLGNNQVALSRLGGTMKGAGGDVAKAGGGLSSLAEAAEQIPGPIGGIASKLKQLKALGPAAAVAAIVVGLVALGVAAAMAAWQFGKFVLQSADAARSAGLLREASAVGSASAKDLEGAMLRVEGKTSATREAVSGLVEEYSRLRLSLSAIEGATSAVTVATQAAGQAAGSTIKGLIDRGVDTKRFWLNALDLKGTGISMREVSTQLAKQMKIAVGAAEAALRDGRVKLEDGIKALDSAVEARFGEVARRQMLALPVQLDRAKKNLAGLFNGVNIEPFLEKLHDVLSLLDETSETGQQLRELAKRIFQPLVDGASSLLPLVEGAIYGIVFSFLLLENIGLRVAIAMKKTFGGSLFKDLDLVTVGFYLAVAAVGAFVAMAVGLAVVLGILGALIAGSLVMGLLAIAPAAIAAMLPFLPLIAVIAALGAIIYAVYKIFTDADLREAIMEVINGAVKAVKDGASKLWDAFKELASGTVKAFKSALGIASPSKVFQAEAKWIPLGAAQGIEDGKPAVASALSTLAEPSAMGGAEAGERLAMAGGSGTTNQVYVNYHGAGSRSDAQRFAGWLFDELETLTLARGRRP
jgi:hypothetical protein